ncbi:Trk system potassium transporter TrkA [Marinicellulosiphila megalodicopiae]|uniref:Trk system potassium transporter TrkA n=1 Tax=Marinicellulosiphila megalodicopiae TaxID=2724896 RepID=UPI003BB2239D
MKIIILGAERVGSTLAATLANEDNDITVVDIDAVRLRELQDKLDIRTIQGPGADPDILFQAGAEDADMLIAVTGSDETNLVACQVAYSLFRTPLKICRIRNHQYLRFKDKLFDPNPTPESFPIDVIISPEQVVTDYIVKLIRYPGALQVLDFAGGLVQLVAIQAIKGGPLVGHQLQTIRDHMPDVEARVAAIYRQNHSIIPTGESIIEDGDEVFFIAAKKNIFSVMSELQEREKDYRRVIIAGGGNIGFSLAKKIETFCSVKLIERDPNRCLWLSENLEKTLVLTGDGSDKELLLEETIESTDIFLALTNDDEANIMSSMLAKRLGARKVMTLINNPAYVDLVQGGEIDIAISPSQATIGSLLTHVRRGDIENVHALRHGAAEALEAIAHGDATSSKVVGRAINDVDLPDGVTIGAVVRGEQVIIGTGDVVIQTDDHVIMFLVDKSKTPEVERLFQVGLTFF